LKSFYRTLRLLFAGIARRSGRDARFAGGRQALSGPGKYLRISLNPYQPNAPIER
jgi:hypothetical protein